MNKKLEIGDEIVIYPEGGLCYTSLKTKNGFATQDFDSSNFPENLTAVFLGIKKGKDGKYYEMYTLKSMPLELKRFYLKGIEGFKNSIEELNAISQILQGRAEDGRKILYSRSINVEDVNEILGVVVDYKNKIVYQKDYPSKNINNLFNFGKRIDIYPLGVKMCNSINSEFIKENPLESTAYCYIIENLEISRKQEEIVKTNNLYYLASHSVYVTMEAYFGVGVVYSNDNNNYEWYSSVEAVYLFDSNGREYSRCCGVRPVFYLESNIQNEVIEEQQEEKVLTEYNNKVETKKEKN